MTLRDTGTELLDHFGPQIDQIAEPINPLVRELVAMRKEHALRAHQAEWHVRGLAYHCRNLLTHYREIAKAASMRVAAGIEEGKPNTLAAAILHVPDCQSLMFEFYALVNLAKISLDRLRDLLAPVFKTPFVQLPKSIKEYRRGRTDCPVYHFLATSHDLVTYLSDIRDCLVHFRSFATTDIALVVDEDEHRRLPDFVSEQMPGIFRATFRVVDSEHIAVNVCLPDEIFQTDKSGKRLCRFTYDRRIALLSQSLEFLRLVSLASAASLRLLIFPGVPTYTFR